MSTTTPNDGSVRLRNLSKSFANERGHTIHAAVKDLSLEIHNGEFLVLVGPSGCGKSTTLRLIAGLENPTAGTIEIGGSVVNDLDPKDRGIAMVFQNYALYPHMTVFENMSFALKLAGKSKPEIREAVLRAAAALDLESLLERKPQSLSGGQRQRVALGRALVRNPRVFLFDEPLSNLDAKMRVQMRTEIARLHARLKTTMIYVTHDQVEAMTLGDRICVMRDGVIQQLADPLTLYRQPQNLFIASFIGSPAMNLIHGRVRQLDTWAFCADEDYGGLRIPLSGRLARLAPKLGDRALVLGVRPEHLTASPESVGFQTEFETEFIEQMGAESIINLKCGTGSLIARIFGEHEYQPGTRFKATFDLEKVHLFDGATEQILDGD